MVPVDTFSGWREALPIRTETAAEVAKASLKETVPGLDSQDPYKEIDGGPAFVFQVTKGIMGALGIKWTLYSAWRPQSSSKVERTNQTLKQALASLCQKLKKTELSCFPDCPAPSVVGLRG